MDTRNIYLLFEADLHVSSDDLEFPVYMRITLNFKSSSIYIQILRLEACTAIPSLCGI